MSAAAVLQPPLIHAPSENWDDDFEFGAGGSASASPRGADARHLTADSQRGPRRRASMALSDTENWDDDYLNDDAQPGPSTATATARRPSHTPRHSKGSTRTTVDIWDDEFAESPRAAGSAATWDGDGSPNPNLRRHHSPVAAASQSRSRRVSHAHSQDASFSSDDDDAEFGHIGHDDDRTVTSSTRSRPFTVDAMPDVPPLPASSRMSPTRPAPLPASPTLSSFSATASYAPSQYSSTAHLALRPTHSTGSSGEVQPQGQVFAQHQPGVLRKPPPAAQNGQARPRRRLRKKSRPTRVGDDIFELDDRGGVEDDERAARLARLAEHVSGMTSTETDIDELPENYLDDGGEYVPPVTPEPHAWSRPQSVASNAHHAHHSVVSFSPVPVATPSSAVPSTSTSPVRSPILSRLGSVKRWAKGARRLSTAPSDVSSSPVSVPDPDMAYRERARSPLGEPSAHELQPLGGKRSTNTLQPQQDDNAKNNSANSKSWFFRHDGGALRGHKSRDALKDPPGPPPDQELSVPHPAAFPRRGSDAGLDNEESEHREAKERRGILGLRRISLLGGSHKRQRSGVEDGNTPTSPTEAKYQEQLAGFSFPPPQTPGEPHTPPPIELSPPSPSPPRKSRMLVGTMSEPIVQGGPMPSTPPNVKFAVSSQAASLGRNGTPTIEAQREIARRNSLGDLKPAEGGLRIPARISRAQVGLKRDLGLVREFATCVDQLKGLQQAYLLLLRELRVLLDATVSPASASSSSSSTRLFHLPRAPLARPPETSEHARRLQQIEHEYSIWWECAEVLIELGGTGPAASTSEPQQLGSSDGTEREKEKERSSGKKRERAITLVSSEPPVTMASSYGPPQASPQNHWRASTGRHDLSQRQLVLLKQMLNTPDPSTFVVGNVMAVTRPQMREVSGDASLAGNSTSSDSRIGLGIELPEVDLRALTPSPLPGSPHSKARRGSRGITGLRDLLRSFRRHGQSSIVSSSVSNAATSRSDLPPTGSATTSSASVSAQDEPKSSTARQRKPRSSTGAHTVVSEQEAKRKREVHPNSPYGTVGAVPAKTPRRPSLASLFRLAGGKSKVARQPSNTHTETHRSEDADYSDWDRVESASDLELPGGVMVPAVPETIRGSKKSRYSVLQATPPATVRRPRSRSVSRTRGASASRSSVNLVAVPAPVSVPVTPSPSKSKPAYSRMFRSARPGSRDGGPPSQAFVHTLPTVGPSNPATPTQESENHRQGRERSSTTPSRRPGSRSVSTNHPQAMTDPIPQVPDLKLALTPENLGPLLDYAREVSARLSECVAELRMALGPRNSPTPELSSGSVPS